MRPALILACTILFSVAEPAFAHHVMGGQMPGTALQGFLSGLGHPVIGLDHLAALVAVGCLAATQARGAAAVVVFVAAMAAGAAAHVGQMNLWASEILAALAVVLLGAALVMKRTPSAGITFALFAGAGLVHGYALAESIIGAERTPLLAYFAGLVIVQSGIALAAMHAVRLLAARGGEMAPARLIGAGIAGIGLAILVAQVAQAG